MTTNKYVLNWINEMAEMTQPDQIVWIDGSEKQAEGAIQLLMFPASSFLVVQMKVLPSTRATSFIAVLWR